MPLKKKSSQSIYFSFIIFQEQITAMKGKIVSNARENEEKNKILREVS